MKPNRAAILLVLLITLALHPACAAPQQQISGASLLDQGSAAEITPIAPASPLQLDEELSQLKSEFHPQLDTSLNLVLRERQQRPDNWQALALQRGLRIEDERIFVTFTMLSASQAESARKAIPELGGEVITHFDRWIDALIPLDSLEQAANLPGVSLIHTPISISPNQDAPPTAPSDSALPRASESPAIISEGVARSNANSWHAAGLTGQNMQVAVFDSFLYADLAQVAGELPLNIQVYPPGGMLDASTTHGTNVAEIIYDMAPGVSLTFTSPNFNPYDFPSTCTDMASKIVGLAQAGNQIISSSMNLAQCGSNDGDPNTNPLNLAAYQVINDYDVLYINSSGNNAEAHWDGQYIDNDGDQFHDFAPGVDFNPLGTLSGGSFLFLRWNGWPTTNQDYDLYLYQYNGTTFNLVAYSINLQTGSQPPMEMIFAPVSGDNYVAVIHRKSASAAAILDMSTMKIPLYYHVSDRSLSDPATSAHVFSVAAVDVNSLGLEWYSSRGPTYGPGGTLTGGWPQPQISGFANVTTWVNTMYDPNQTKFNGTSAAAPHVAGAAALVWGANPCLTPADVGSFLKDRSIDAGAPGYDYSYGRGVLNLGAPTNNLCAPVFYENNIFLPVIIKP